MFALVRNPVSQNAKQQPYLPEADSDEQDSILQSSFLVFIVKSLSAKTTVKVFIKVCILIPTLPFTKRS